MLISKKDLLKETGISYGQLYRWKREGLIPDEWFQKQSSYTGQETFFEAEKILERVSTIQKLKSTHSLEEIREIISHTPYRNGIDRASVLQMPEICEEACDLYEKDSYTYYELTFLYILTDLRREHQINDVILCTFAQAVQYFFTDRAKEDQKLVVYSCEKRVYASVVSAKAEIELDPRLEKISEYVIDDIMFKLKKSRE